MTQTSFAKATNVVIRGRGPGPFKVIRRWGRFPDASDMKGFGVVIEGGEEVTGDMIYRYLQ